MRGRTGRAMGLAMGKGDAARFAGAGLGLGTGVCESTDGIDVDGPGGVAEGLILVASFASRFSRTCVEIVELGIDWGHC